MNIRCVLGNKPDIQGGNIDGMIDFADNHPAEVNIPVRSKRQAMDWSLVLASQDIASTILHSEQDHCWYLLIEEKDQQRALAAIQQYRLENRGWGWRQTLPWSGISFHWGVLAWAVTLGLFHGIAADQGVSFQNAGMMNSAAVMAGQWWRLFTAMTLHADMGHLASNLSIGALFLGLAMARFGAGWGLLAAYFAGAAGNCLGLLLDPLNHRSLGASGMVMGGLGLVAVQSLFLWRQNPRAARIILSGMITGTMLFILFGLNPDSDVSAHLGGFLAGSFFGMGLTILPRRWIESTWANGVTIVLLGTIVVWTWRLALH